MSKLEIPVKFLKRISVLKEGDTIHEQTWVVKLENGLTLPVEDNSRLGNNKLIGKKAKIKLILDFALLKKLKKPKFGIVTGKNFLVSKCPEATNMFYGKVTKLLKKYYGLKAIHVDTKIAKVVVMLGVHPTVFKYPKLKEGDFIKVYSCITQLDEVVKTL